MIAAFSTFNSHLAESDLRIGDRLIEFVSTVSARGHATQNTNDRFVYYCHFMPEREVAGELNFLVDTVQHKCIAALLAKMYPGLLVGYAYSLMRMASGRYRESFYFFPCGETVSTIAESFGIVEPHHRFGKQYFLGIDVVDGDVVASKFYYKVNRKTASELLGNDAFLRLTNDNIVATVRTARNRPTTGFKIEPFFDKNDSDVYRQLCGQEFAAVWSRRDIRVNRISFDYDEGKAFPRKVSAYYGPTYCDW